MFKRMYLALEENRLRDRFGGTVTTAIIEVLNKKTNDDDVIIRIKNLIFQNPLIFQGLPPIKYQNLMYFPLFLPL